MADVGRDFLLWLGLFSSTDELDDRCILLLIEQLLLFTEPFDVAGDTSAADADDDAAAAMAAFRALAAAELSDRLGDGAGGGIDALLLSLLLV